MQLVCLNAVKQALGLLFLVGSLGSLLGLCMLPSLASRSSSTCIALIFLPTIDMGATANSISFYLKSVINRYHKVAIINL